MKRIGLLLAMALAPALVMAQAARLKLPDLSGLAAKATQSVDIDLDGERLRTAAAFLGGAAGAADAEFAEVVKGLQEIHVKVFSFDKPDQYSMRDIEPVVTQVQSLGWKKLLSVRNKEEHVEIWLHDNAADGGLFLLVNKPMELVVINIVGKVDLQTLAKLQGKLGVPAMPGAMPAAPASGAGPRP